MHLFSNTPTLSDLKAEARELRRESQWNGTPISHAQALERIARRHGARDWNTLHAQTRAKTRPAVGARVAGHYLGQPFQGHLRGLKLLGDGQRAQINIQFDDPVDVVTFDSFSAYRQRVSATVGPDGRSFSKTSNGVPHMQVERVLG